MPIDREKVQQFLLQVDAEIVPVLGAGATKLLGCQKLVANYQAACTAWHSGSVGHIQDITTWVNELCIARRILASNKIRSAHYEPPLEGMEKTIDFLVVRNEAGIFYDVKTVQPSIKDTWDRYERFKKKSRFTSGTELDLDKGSLGGEIAHERIASREKFLDYTLELEAKIRAIPKENGNRFCLVFCGDGVRWRRDHLEDFADFYFSGQCRQDDSLGSMQSHHMMEKGMAFDRSIHGFCYFERKICSPNPTVFQCGIRRPRIPWENPQ